jgi:hypothetical protein
MAAGTRLPPSARAKMEWSIVAHILDATLAEVPLDAHSQRRLSLTIVTVLPVPALHFMLEAGALGVRAQMKVLHAIMVCHSAQGVEPSDAWSWLPRTIKNTPSFLRSQSFLQSTDVHTSPAFDTAELALLVLPKGRVPVEWTELYEELLERFRVSGKENQCRTPPIVGARSTEMLVLSSKITVPLHTVVATLHNAVNGSDPVAKQLACAVRDNSAWRLACLNTMPAKMDAAAIVSVSTAVFKSGIATAATTAALINQLLGSPPPAEILRVFLLSLQQTKEEHMLVLPHSAFLLYHCIDQAIISGCSNSSALLLERLFDQWKQLLITHPSTTGKEKGPLFHAAVHAVIRRDTHHVCRQLAKVVAGGDPVALSYVTHTVREWFVARTTAAGKEEQQHRPPLGFVQEEMIQEWMSWLPCPSRSAVLAGVSEVTLNALRHPHSNALSPAVHGNPSLQLVVALASTQWNGLMARFTGQTFGEDDTTGDVKACSAHTGDSMPFSAQYGVVPGSEAGWQSALELCAVAHASLGKGPSHSRALSSRITRKNPQDLPPWKVWLTSAARAILGGGGDPKDATFVGAFCRLSMHQSTAFNAAAHSILKDIAAASVVPAGGSTEVLVATKLAQFAAAVMASPAFPLPTCVGVSQLFGAADSILPAAAASHHPLASSSPAYLLLRAVLYSVAAKGSDASCRAAGRHPCCSADFARSILGIPPPPPANGGGGTDGAEDTDNDRGCMTRVLELLVDEMIARRNTSAAVVDGGLAKPRPEAAAAEERMVTAATMATPSLMNIGSSSQTAQVVGPPEGWFQTALVLLWNLMVHWRVPATRWSQLEALMCPLEAQLQVVLNVLIFLTEIVLIVLIFPTEIVLTVLIFLTEIVLTVLVVLTEIVLTVLIFPTEIVLTVLILLTEIVLNVLAFLLKSFILF